MDDTDGKICINNICCPDSCMNCGVCTGNLTIDSLCCLQTILNNNHTCDKFQPPCIQINTNPNNNAGITECVGKICCPNTCNKCTVCTGNPSMDFLCCSQTILNSNRTCDQNPPPCVLTGKNNDNNNDESYTDYLYGFIQDIPNIIVLGVLFVLLLLMIYACTCFDRRKPPTKYSNLDPKGFPKYE